MARGIVGPGSRERAPAERLLDWHQASRERGGSRISLLIGAPREGSALFGRWLERVGRELVELEAASEREVAAAYLERLERSGLLAEGAIERAASLLGDRPTRLAARLEDLEGGELGALFEALAPRWPREPAELRPLAEATLARRARAPEPAMPPADGELLGAAASLLAAARLPGLLLHPPERRLEEAGEMLARLAARAPLVPIAVTMTESAFRDLVEPAPDRRWKALLREGRIDLGPEREPSEPPPAEDAEELGELDALRRRAADLLVRAGRGEVPFDEARSAAERLLFTHLQADPETTGLFELNGELEVSFGPAPAEVDLLCRRYAVAVEVDGYHHFGDPEAFRRDRRKDVLLQKQGLLVVRCLAEDVVLRTGEVMGSVRDALRFQRHAPTNA